jgi:hypothetical protein
MATNSKSPSKHPERRPAADTSQSFDWYSEGEARTVEADGVRITVRFVGRKGRRARIAITAPAGAVFDAGEPGTNGVTANSSAGSGFSK